MPPFSALSSASWTAESGGERPQNKVQEAGRDRHSPEKSAQGFPTEPTASLPVHSEGDTVISSPAEKAANSGAYIDCSVAGPTRKVPPRFARRR